MTEQTTSQEQEPGKQSLEDLYGELEIKEPQQQPQPQETKLSVGNDAAILEEIRSLKAEMAAEKETRARNQENSDFKDAVATLAEVSGLKGKETLLKGLLLGKASEDERLRKLWENRAENPKTWESALGILAEEAKSAFVVTDPQLEENQRAMDESQRSRSAVAPETPSKTDELMKMPDGQFQQVWQQILRGG